MYNKSRKDSDLVGVDIGYDIVRDFCLITRQVVNAFLLNNMEIDNEQLRKLGGRYVLTAYKIGNAEENHLRLKKLSSKLTELSIYLYEVWD